MAADPQDIVDVEAKERSEFYEDFASILAHNMGFIFAGKAANDELTIEHAVAGAVAMLEFGLVLAARHPVEAALLMVAAQERDERDGLPISTSKAVDSVVQTFKELRSTRN